MGPGPFTGLRVGIAAARAFAFGAGTPVVPVVSHDAIAFGASRRRSLVADRRAPPRGLLVGVRGARMPTGLPVRIGTARLSPSRPSSTAVTPTRRYRGSTRATVVARRRSACSPSALVRDAAPFAADEPLYLRSPDVTLSAGPKRVTRMTWQLRRATARRPRRDHGDRDERLRRTTPGRPTLMRAELGDPHGYYLVARRRPSESDRHRATRACSRRAGGGAGRHPDHRRRARPPAATGLGRALMQRADRRGRATAAPTEVFLEVRADNPGAQALYEIARLRAASPCARTTTSPTASTRSSCGSTLAERRS